MVVGWVEQQNHNSQSHLKQVEQDNTEPMGPAIQRHSNTLQPFTYAGGPPGPACGFAGGGAALWKFTNDFVRSTSRC